MNAAAPVAITALLAEHWPDVARIYGEGIATRNSTFETEVPDWGTWDDDHMP